MTFSWSHRIRADLRVGTFRFESCFVVLTTSEDVEKTSAAPEATIKSVYGIRKILLRFLYASKKNWNQNTIRIYPKFSNRFFEIKITFLRVLKVFVILPVFESRCVSVFFPIRLFLIYCDAILRALLRSRQKMVIFWPISEPSDLFMVMFINLTIWAPSNSC